MTASTLAPRDVVRRDLPQRDVDAIVALAEPDLLRWRDARFLVTGATGFVGSWLTRSLVEANHQLDLGLHIVALARRPELGVIDANCVTPIAADVRDLDAGTIASVGHVDTVIHLACSSSAPAGGADHDARRLSSTIIDGTRAVLRLAAASGRLRTLVASSGAVHGRGSERPRRVTEDCPSAALPGEPGAAYGLAKRLMECEAFAATDAGEVDVTVARMWAFVGPLLPLDIHYAAGNFVADALAGRPILVTGDPGTVRSYLYPIDLVCWLLAALTRGRPGVAYNVGSDVETTIGELAATVARISGNTAGIRLSGVTNRHATNRPAADCYVPDTTRARTELGVTQTVDLNDAIERTLRWHCPDLRCNSSVGDRS